MQIIRIIMKLACVGKGGSGKTTLSWLLATTERARGTRVLAVDADHNMDFTSLLGAAIDDTTHTIHRTHAAFKHHVGLPEASPLSQLLERAKPPRITLDDSYSSLVTIPTDAGIPLITTGLGLDDVLTSGKCAHGNSNPLKYYLGLLDEGDALVVVDGVAGADMLNFGLFAGCDALITAVEPTRNSIKVFEQLLGIAARSKQQLFGVITKSRDSDERTYLHATWGEILLAEVPIDDALISYNAGSLSRETSDAAERIITKAREQRAATPSFDRLRAFENARRS